ncbi:MAG: hypothetical protein IH623_22730 [Verrucomicrobia bacterium]|nr:hypothetical protein [Verrucomicrobiota bacterium]
MNSNWPLDRTWESVIGGEEEQETDEHKTQRLVLDELRKRRWTERELKQRRTTRAGKVEMAARLRGGTVMTMEWIAQRLPMGCRHTVANCLKR